MSLPVVQELIATRFLAASGLCCTLWDHFLTIDDEIHFVWSRPWTLTKTLFVTNRYMVEGALLYAAYVFAGFRPQLDQHVFMVMMALFAFSTMGMANAFMAMRHYALWDRRKAATVALWVAFAVSYGSITVFTVLIAQDIFKWSTYSAQLQACVVIQKPTLIIGSWACMLAFDVFTLVLAITNSFDRPHRHRVDAILNLKRDGAAFFVALLLLRLMNLVLTIMLSSMDIFLTSFFVWSMICVTLSRLILRVEAIKDGTAVTPASSTAVHLYERNRWRPREL